MHHTTLWKYITKHLEDTLQCLTDRAIQHSEVERDEFNISLQVLIQNDPEILVMVDETHKDKNAAKRRRGCAKKNGGGFHVDQWFKHVICYTMIGFVNINGFVEEACKTYLRNEISYKCAAGTVTRDIFENWVKTHLCQILGHHCKGETRSVVILDNATTHTSNKVLRMIEDTKAEIIYTAPFSPYLNLFGTKQAGKFSKETQEEVPPMGQRPSYSSTNIYV